jgi:hypothetical protein
MHKVFLRANIEFMLGIKPARNGGKGSCDRARWKEHRFLRPVLICLPRDKAPTGFGRKKLRLGATAIVKT